jgi:hypothetical protein
MSYKCNCLNIEYIYEKKKKGLELFQHPLANLKISIISSPTEAPQKVRKHHLLHNNTLSTIISPPTSKQVNFTSRHNPR